MNIFLPVVHALKNKQHIDNQSLIKNFWIRKDGLVKKTWWRKVIHWVFRLEQKKEYEALLEALKTTDLSVKQDDSFFRLLTLTHDVGTRILSKDLPEKRKQSIQNSLQKFQISIKNELEVGGYKHQVTANIQKLAPLLLPIYFSRENTLHLDPSTSCHTFFTLHGSKTGKQYPLTHLSPAFPTNPKKAFSREELGFMLQLSHDFLECQNANAAKICLTYLEKRLNAVEKIDLDPLYFSSLQAVLGQFPTFKQVKHVQTLQSESYYKNNTLYVPKKANDDWIEYLVNDAFAKATNIVFPDSIKEKPILFAEQLILCMGKNPNPALQIEPSLKEQLDKLNGKELLLILDKLDGLGLYPDFLNVFCKIATQQELSRFCQNLKQPLPEATAWHIFNNTLPFPNCDLLFSSLSHDFIETKEDSPVWIKLRSKTTCSAFPNQGNGLVTLSPDKINDQLLRKLLEGDFENGKTTTVDFSQLPNCTYASLEWVASYPNVSIIGWEKFQQNDKNCYKIGDKFYPIPLLLRSSYFKSQQQFKANNDFTNEFDQYFQNWIDNSTENPAKLKEEAIANMVQTLATGKSFKWNPLELNSFSLSFLLVNVFAPEEQKQCLDAMIQTVSTLLNKENELNQIEGILQGVLEFVELIENSKVLPHQQMNDFKSNLLREITRSMSIQGQLKSEQLKKLKASAIKEVWCFKSEQELKIFLKNPPKSQFNTCEILIANFAMDKTPDFPALMKAISNSENLSLTFEKMSLSEGILDLIPTQSLTSLHLKSFTIEGTNDFGVRKEIRKILNFSNLTALTLDYNRPTFDLGAFNKKEALKSLPKLENIVLKLSDYSMGFSPLIHQKVKNSTVVKG